MITVYTKGEGMLVYDTSKYCFNEALSYLLITGFESAVKKVIIPMSEIMRIKVEDKVISPENITYEDIYKKYLSFWG